jgi:hypothetical protein
MTVHTPLQEKFAPTASQKQGGHTRHALFAGFEGQGRVNTATAPSCMTCSPTIRAEVCAPYSIKKFRQPSTRGPPPAHLPPDLALGWVNEGPRPSWGACFVQHVILSILGGFPVITCLALGL